MCKCIVCGTQMKEDYSYYDSSVQCEIESSYSCPKCGYYREYAYGDSKDGVLGIAEFNYSYHYFDKEKYKKFKKKLWSYRKKLLRLHKIKGRYNKL